jgi:hypothetical protein
VPYFSLKHVDVANVSIHDAFYIFFVFSILHLRLQLHPLLLLLIPTNDNNDVLSTLRQLHNHSNNHHNTHHLPSLMHVLRPNYNLDRNLRPLHMYRQAEL